MMCVGGSPLLTTDCKLPPGRLEVMPQAYKQGFQASLLVLLAGGLSQEEGEQGPVEGER